MSVKGPRRLGCKRDGRGYKVVQGKRYGMYKGNRERRYERYHSKLNLKRRFTDVRHVFVNQRNPILLNHTKRNWLYYLMT
jgi:hypothetical protein